MIMKILTIDFLSLPQYFGYTDRELLTDVKFINICRVHVFLVPTNHFLVLWLRPGKIEVNH
jgi:hypothetical protein